MFLQFVLNFLCCSALLALTFGYFIAMPNMAEWISNRFKVDYDHCILYLLIPPTAFCLTVTSLITL